MFRDLDLSASLTYAAKEILTQLEGAGRWRLFQDDRAPDYRDCLQVPVGGLVYVFDEDILEVETHTCVLVHEGVSYVALDPRNKGYIPCLTPIQSGFFYRTPEAALEAAAVEIREIAASYEEHFAKSKAVAALLRPT